MSEQALIGVAAVVATLLGSLGVLGQILVAKRQANLGEASAYRDQARAWLEIRGEWEQLLAAGLGPERARQRGVKPTYCDTYGTLLEQCRRTRVEAMEAFDGGVSEERQAALWVREREAFDALVPVEQAIRRVLVHCAQLADLIIRRRLSVDAVYDAVGHDLLREREAVEAVTRHAYDFGGCVAPAFEEARWWAGLTVDEISPRVGWARALEASPATLSRIDVLLDLLAMRAYEVGDGMHAVTGDHQMSEVGTQSTLPVRWRVLRRVGLMVAFRFCWHAASTHQRIRRSRGSRLFRPVVVAVKVAAAAAKSRRAWDESRWVSPVELPAEQSEAVRW